MPWTLVLLSLLECALAALYLALGWHYARLKGTETFGFALFWGGIGAYGMAEAWWSLLVAAWPGVPLAVGVTTLHVKILLVNAAFAGLCGYLLRLYTGRPWRGAVVAYYLVAWFLLLDAYNWSGPVGQEVQTWRGGLLYARPGNLWTTLAPLATIVPALLAALGFVLLLRHTAEPATRRRVTRLAFALVVFLGGLAVGSFIAGWFWWPLVEKLLAFGAAAVAWSSLRADGSGPRA